MSGAEADKPLHEKEKMMVKNGGRFSLAERTFEIVEGSVIGDYGACSIKDIALPDELLTFRYETVDAKCKRIKVR